MTTTVALAARDFIAVGADSLATTSMHLLNPMDAISTFFEPNGDLKANADGKPLLKHSGQLWELASSRPVDQLPSVTKVFPLSRRNAAVLFAGTARIGDTSVKNLVEQFIDIEDRRDAGYTIDDLAQRLRDFVVEIYEAEIKEAHARPEMEILLAGYSAPFRQPEINRLVFQWDWSKKTFLAEVRNEVARGKYSVVFGGQYDVIQRVVNGIDVSSWLALKNRCWEILDVYRGKIQSDLAAHGRPLEIIPPDRKDPDLDLFAKNFGGVFGIFANVSDLSEHAGIEFVRFLISTMIKAQEFSAQIPTVGGEVHVAVLTKKSGFQWISKPYSHRAGDSPHPEPSGNT